ncbi:MAG TPA: family 20 glycosylhydrolase [Candidatus Angelobacter sp.]|nr:family 20 glycosylhydrolase [Candidatus Angelobacter sp.]
MRRRIMGSVNLQWTWLVLTAVLAGTCLVRGQTRATLPLMPLPANVQPGDGRFVLDVSSYVIEVGGPGAGDARVSRAVARFQRAIARRGLQAGDHAAGKAISIFCIGPGENIQRLGEDESYHLNVTSREVRLSAPTPLGVIHGLQTFLQLLTPDPDGLSAPAVTIEDSPRFPWRGLLIDVSRHFMPIDAIKRNLDGMEAVKLNVLHWHLSDDQGFRVESKRFPKLQQLASDGQYYTQEEIRDVIAYARNRGIRVVPEFDMPGHTTSWFAAYPDLASGPGPYQIWRRFGVNDAAMDPSRDHTYHFLDDFIGEMSRLFPDEYFHIGGDEVNGKQWDANAAIRKFKRRHHLANHHDLQAYFNRKLETIVKRHKKIMVGWDEILHGDLPKDVVVQSWRGQRSLADAARQGYRGLLSYGYYLDLMQQAAQHYSIDPLGDSAAGLTEEEKARVLGGEACMWAEFVTAGNIDERIWPRVAAVAERLWSPQDVRDADDMYRRLAATSDYLASIGVLHQEQYRVMLERLAGSRDVDPLRVLADVLEPVKGYARPHSRQYETTTPLNRLVDAVRPESDAGREFAALTQRFLQKPDSIREAATLNGELTAWQDNGQRLTPLLESNPLLQEALPVSQNLSAVAATGLQALRYLTSTGRAPAAWRDQQLAFLKDAQKPQAEVLNTIVPSVLKLVEATVPE